MATDLTQYEDDVLDGMRIAILTEQERRQRCAQLPEQIGDLCRAAVAAGVPVAEVLAAAETGTEPSTPAEQPAEEPAPTEQAAPTARPTEDVTE